VTLLPDGLRLQRAVAGRYAIERELGRGGMGVVYLARDIALDRPVAIKVLPPELTVRPDLRARFIQEARTAAKLSHPNIVAIHAVEDHDDLVFFVMAFIDGETLAQRVARAGPMPVGEVLRIAQEVSWALAYAHQRGVVHRDVKPENILLERASGRALVTDFGIALPDHRNPGTPDPGILGTLRYMSPEQIAGGALDGRTDLYSLGLVIHAALTGVPPVPGAAVAAPAAAPGAVREILGRCLAPAADDRFPNGEGLATALGDARGFAAPTPAAVRRFLDVLGTFSHEVSSYVAIVAVMIGMAVVGGAASQPMFLSIAVGVVLVMSGLFMLRSNQLLGTIRRLLAEGFDAGDAWRALLREADADPGAGRVEPRTIALAGGAGLAWLALVLAAPIGAGPLVNGLVFTGIALYPIVMIRGLLQRLVGPSRSGLWTRLWRVFEWKFFGKARLGLGRAPGLGPHRTEISLGDGARRLLQTLPPDDRERLRDLPGLIQRLEDQIRRLRDLPDPAAAERRRAALLALESLRLDLLQMSTAGTESGSFTESIAKAEALSRRIEALLEVRRVAP
jgi:serine/threonine-protein kinase